MGTLNVASRLIFLFALAVSNLGRAEENAPLALVYRGPVAGCKGCAEAIAEVLKAAKYGLEVKFVGPNEELPLSVETLRTAAVYAQPGGDGSAAKASALIEDELGGKEALAEWVRKGGRYYGTCLGAYLAGKPEGWDGVTTDTSGWGFGLLPGLVGQWIRSPHAAVSNTKEAVVEVVWEGESRWLFFQDGPHFDIPPHFTEDAQVRVMATYKSNGLPAAAVAPLGRGKVAVVGPHPEATHHWFDRSGLEDPSDPDGTKGHALDLARNLVDQLLSE